MRKLMFLILAGVFTLGGCDSDEPKPDPITEVPDEDDDDTVATAVYLKDHTAFPIGNIVSAVRLSSTAGETFREILLNDFNSITAENDMKMAEIFRGPDSYNFTKGNAIVAYAAESGIRVHGHALVWHSSVPGWLNNYSGTDEEFATLIENYIKTTVSHFAEFKDEDGNAVVASWDVLNEYFDGSSARNSIFRQRMGDGYHKKLFQWAREADPNVKLFYNDYNIAGQPGKRNVILNMVADFQANDIPIDGIGMQMHLNHDWPTNDLPLAVEEIAGTGLLVHVSELDVKVNYNDDITEFTEERAAQQADQYQRVAYYYTTLVPSSQQFGITFWGMRDEDSWLYNGGTDWPLLYDNDYNPKPAYNSFIRGLKGVAPE